jgi:hypothetical protein
MIGIVKPRLPVSSGKNIVMQVSIGVFGDFSMT